jgi:N-hydroxyarylamine O-acetyltransferase
VISPDLTERVLDKLGIDSLPEVDLAGLNSVYAAFSGGVSNDNIQKRIWFGGNRSTPVTGGDPSEFFENWLRHGTGGTCFPINGAFAVLLQALDFPARRIASTMMAPGATRGISNHGTVLVSFDGVDYLADAQTAGFDALPLLQGQESRTARDIHAMRAAPIEDGHEVWFWTGHMRENEFRFQTEPENDPVDHARFLSLYDRSANAEGYSPFNSALYICRHFEDSVLSIHQGIRVAVAADGSLTSEEVDDAQTREALVEELGISEEAVDALPKDEPGGPEVAIA